jgi:hypothetical protein
MQDGECRRQAAERDILAGAGELADHGGKVRTGQAQVATLGTADEHFTALQVEGEGATAADAGIEADFRQAGIGGRGGRSQRWNGSHHAVRSASCRGGASERVRAVGVLERK